MFRSGVCAALVFAVLSSASPSRAAGIADPGDGTKAGEESSNKGLGLSFCWCPAGTFKMGSPPKEVNRDPRGSIVEEEQVDVTLTHGFWMAKHELTQAAWESVMHTTLDQQRAKALSADSNSVGPRFPIVCVSHDEAMEFCRKLTQQEHDAGRLSKNWEFRLPTEAQWEYACRAGTKTATHFGDSLSSDDANFNGAKPYNKGKAGPKVLEEREVGQYKPNAWGLYDMHGNVSEWCLDFQTKSLPGGTDPVVLMGGDNRIERGGDTYVAGRHCRSAARGYGKHDFGGAGLGFRPALVFVSK